jgi:HK97 family phage prohead protease
VDATPNTSATEATRAPETTEEHAMERRDLTGTAWTPRQGALYKLVEAVAEVFGAFDKSTGPDGVHYAAAADNPFAAEGLACAGCAFYEGGGACELLAPDDRVEPGGVCKFWIIPGDRLPASEQVPTDTAPMDPPAEEGRALVEADPFTGPALVALIGPPGAGKTSWLARELPNAERVSLEAIRTKPDADRAAVIRDAIARTFDLLRAGELVAFDSTLIDPTFRSRVRAVAKAVGVPVHAVVFRTPIEKLLAAQDTREHPVPEERVRELARKFDEQLAQIPGEGWASVTTVSREGSQERGRAEEFAELRDRLAGETRSLSVAMTEARALPNEDGGYTIEGHAAVFDSASYPLPDGRGGTFVEVVKRGAFRKALANPETPTALLMNHNADLILASSGSGTLQMYEDPKGLRIRAQVAPTSYAEDLRVLMDRGDVSGMSFGFTVEADRWWQDGDGRTRRDIQRIGRLTDVSVVVSPAYGSASAEIAQVREAETPHEEASASAATGGPSAAALADTRRRRLELLDLTTGTASKKEQE